jgi:DNA-binding protein YbaB
MHRHQIGKLDRFVGQAQRTARRAEREFKGVTIEVDAEGMVSVHAIGMRPMLL